MTPSTDLLVVPSLDGWQPQWDQLVEQSPLPSPFLRSWWLTGTGGPRRHFLLVVDDGRLVGGLAVEEDRRLGLQRLQLMGSGDLCPDHLDLLAAPGYEDTTINLMRAWLSRPGGRLLDFQGVRAGSRLMEAMPVPARCGPLAVAPWSPLPSDGQVFVAALPSNFRRQVRRASARLAADGVTHRINRGAMALGALDTLRQLHHAQWGDGSHFLPNFDRFAAACQLGAEADEIVIHELATEQTVISTVLAFEVAGRVSLYQSARLTDSHWREAPAVLLTAIITDACDRGFTEVDFLRGEEPYKDRFATRRRELVRLLAGKGLSGRIACASAMAALGATRLAVRSVRAGRGVLARAKR